MNNRMPGVVMCGLVLILVSCLGLGCTRAAPVYERPVQDPHYQRELEEIKKNMRGDVRIRLKRDGKGAYSWEVSGKDANEIIKSNATLSKKISNEQHE